MQIVRICCQQTKLKEILKDVLQAERKSYQVKIGTCRKERRALDTLNINCFLLLSVARWQILTWPTFVFNSYGLTIAVREQKLLDWIQRRQSSSTMERAWILIGRKQKEGNCPLTLSGLPSLISSAFKVCGCPALPLRVPEPLTPA